MYLHVRAVEGYLKGSPRMRPALQSALAINFLTGAIGLSNISSSEQINEVVARSDVESESVKTRTWIALEMSVSLWRPLLFFKYAGKKTVNKSEKGRSVFAR